MDAFGDAKKKATLMRSRDESAWRCIWAALYAGSVTE